MAVSHEKKHSYPELIGVRIKTKGLDEDELNGRRGTITGPFQQTNCCYPVKLDGSDEGSIIFLSPEHLQYKKKKSNHTKDDARKAQVKTPRDREPKKASHGLRKGVPVAPSAPEGKEDSSKSFTPKDVPSSNFSRDVPSTSAAENQAHKDTCDEEAPSHPPDTADSTSENKSEEVGHGVGCLKGLSRDRHSGIAICTILLLIFGILYSSYAISPVGYAVFIVLAFYLFQSCRSNTFRYVRSVVLTETVVDYVNRMYNAPPEVRWDIQCYHYEKRIRYKKVYSHTTTSTNFSGQVVKTEHYKTVPEEYEVRVDTHSASGRLHYGGWKDLSKPLEQDIIEEHQVTKLHLSKRWIGDAGANDQQIEFIRRNDRDVKYDFTETLSIPGYHEHYLGLNDIKCRPFLIHWIWYVLAHLTVVYAMPYLLYISSITDKKEAEIIKSVWTGDPPPDCLAPDGEIIAGIGNSVVASTNTRKEVAKRPKPVLACLTFGIYTILILILLAFVALRSGHESSLDPNCRVKIASKIGDGYCDGGDYNTLACGWDGGDCVVKGYPDCHPDDPWMIGDGLCCCASECEKASQVFTEECGWDGGDCQSMNWENPSDPSFCPIDTDDLF